MGMAGEDPVMVVQGDWKDVTIQTQFRTQTLGRATERLQVYLAGRNQIHRVRFMALPLTTLEVFSFLKGSKTSRSKPLRRRNPDLTNHHLTVTLFCSYTSREKQ